MAQVLYLMKRKPILINCMRAIITRGLYTFYPHLEDRFFVFKEIFLEFCPYVWLVFKSGL